MCETHREKDRINRRRKSGREKDAVGDLDEDQVGEHSVITADMGSDSEPPGLVSETPAPSTEPPTIFMDPLLPPEETSPDTMPPQSEMSEYPGIPPQLDPLLSYGSGVSEAGVLSQVTTNLAAAGDVDFEISSRQSVTGGTSVEEHCVGDQEIPNHSQQDIPSMVWGSAMSPVSTSGSDSILPQSTPSSTTRSNTTATADMSSSPATTTVSATSIPTMSAGASHIQPQFQVPYYMPPPFSIPYTPGQPSFLVPGPYPPISYAPHPSYTYAPPVPGPFQTFQYAPPPPGQPGSYALRPYPYPPWGPYASGTIEANWLDSSSQPQLQVHTQGKAQRKRGRAGAASEDGLRIVLVQPKNTFEDGATASATSAIALASTPGPARTFSDPSLSPPSLSAANSPGDDVSSPTGPTTPAEPGEQVATVSLFL